MTAYEGPAHESEVVEAATADAREVPVHESELKDQAEATPTDTHKIATESSGAAVTTGPRAPGAGGRRRESLVLMATAEQASALTSAAAATDATISDLEALLASIKSSNVLGPPTLALTPRVPKEVREGEAPPMQPHAPTAPSTARAASKGRVLTMGRRGSTTTVSASADIAIAQDSDSDDDSTAHKASPPVIDAAMRRRSCVVREFGLGPPSPAQEPLVGAPSRAFMRRSSTLANHSADFAVAADAASAVHRSTASYSIFPSPGSLTTGGGSGGSQNHQGAGRPLPRQPSHTHSSNTSQGSHASTMATSATPFATSSSSLNRRGSMVYRASEGVALNGGPKTLGGKEGFHRASEGNVLTREVAGHDTGNHGGGDEGGEDDDDDGVQTVVSRHQTMSFTAQRISGARASEGTVVLPSGHSGTASGGTASGGASSAIMLNAMASRRAMLTAGLTPSSPGQTTRPISDPNALGIDLSSPSGMESNSALSPSSSKGGGSSSLLSPNSTRTPLMNRVSFNQHLASSSSEGAGMLSPRASGAPFLPAVTGMLSPRASGTSSLPSITAALGGGKGTQGGKMGFFSSLFKKGS